VDEGLRRLEIPKDMQSKYRFQALGPANGKVKSAIFSGNNARLYNIDLKKAELTVKHDEFANMKARNEIEGAERSNLRYGYVIPRNWSTR
jgi:hypothetical protein